MAVASAAKSKTSGYSAVGSSIVVLSVRFSPTLKERLGLRTESFSSATPEFQPSW